MANPRGTVNYNGVVIRSSERTVFIRCADPDCRHVHLIGFDKSGQPFCEMPLTEDMCLTALRLANGGSQ